MKAAHFASLFIGGSTLASVGVKNYGKFFPLSRLILEGKQTGSHEKCSPLQNEGKKKHAGTFKHFKIMMEQMVVRRRTKHLALVPIPALYYKLCLYVILKQK